MKHIVTRCTHCPFARMQKSMGGIKSCVGVYWLGDRDNMDTPTEREFDTYVEGGKLKSLFPETPPDWCPLREDSYSVKLKLEDE